MSEQEQRNRMKACAEAQHTGNTARYERMFAINEAILATQENER